MRFSRKCGIPLLESDAGNLSQFNYTYIFGVIAWQLWIYPGLQFSHGVSISVIYIIGCGWTLALYFWLMMWKRRSQRVDWLFMETIWNIHLSMMWEKFFPLLCRRSTMRALKLRRRGLVTLEKYEKLSKHEPATSELGENHFPWFTFYSFIRRATRSSSQNFRQQTNSRNSPQHEV